VNTGVLNSCGFSECLAIRIEDPQSFNRDVKVTNYFYPYRTVPVPVLHKGKISVAYPVVLFLTPESVMAKKIRIRDNLPGHISKSIVNIFWVKILKFFHCGSGSGIWCLFGPGSRKESRIWEVKV
jgi:hypothetical protein